MANEKERIINIITDCFKADRSVIEKLYENTQKDDEIIIQVLRAGFLLRTAATLETAIGRKNIQGDIPFEFIKSSIQLALLVSAIETVGAPSKYRSFNEWLNKEFFIEREKKYSRREINRAWQQYNEIYGSTKSFRDVILNSGLDELLSEFLLAQPIRLYEFPPSSENYEETIQVRDLKIPEKVVEFAIKLNRDNKSFFVYKKGEYYELLDLSETPIPRLEIFDMTGLNEYYIKVEDLETLSEVITLRYKSLRKLLRPKLNYIYHLRSGYYHKGKSTVSAKTHFMIHGPWKDSDRTEYSPMVSHRLVPLFWKLTRKVIISAWEDKIKTC